MRTMKMEDVPVLTALTASVKTNGNLSDRTDLGGVAVVDAFATLIWDQINNPKSANHNKRGNAAKRQFRSQTA